MENNIFLTSNPSDKDAYKSIMTKTVDAIVDSVNDSRAYAGPTPQVLGSQVGKYEIFPSKGIGFDALLANLKESILPNFLRTASTDYMAHLHSPALLETIASELILSTFNQSMDSWDQSPVATEVEVAVVEKLCTMYGYNMDSSKGIIGDGCFTSGGSQSNLTGIALARDWFCNKTLHHDVKKYGLPENYRKFRLYTSEISHFSMEKSAHLLGLGYNSVVKVPVDKYQKMDITALAQLVAKDVAEGNIPFCLVATIGTTDYGSIDSVSELRKIADTYGMWLHSDAAYGSGLVLSDIYKNRMGNLSICDSITVDFHKMFLLPISCSAILIKNSSHFEPLELHADYLNREEDEEDGYTNLVGKSLQTTRRFDALKVWVAFQVRGQEGMSTLINTCIDNALYVYSRLDKSPDFSPVTKPEISSVVFRVLSKKEEQVSEEEIDELNKGIRRSLIHEKGIVIGQTLYNGLVHLKFTLLNPLLTHEKLDSLLDLILSLR